jgi:hypothetical protein
VTVAEQSDPIRWLHPGSDVPSELRRALESAKGDGGGPGALSSLASRLPLSGVGQLPVSAAAGAAKKAVAAWKVAVWVAGATALGGGAANLVALGLKAPPAVVAAAPATSPVLASPSMPVGAPVESGSIWGADAPSPAKEVLGESVPVPPAGAPVTQRAAGSTAVAARSAESASRAFAPAATSAPPAVTSTPRRGDEQPRTPAEPKGDSLTAEAKLLLRAREAVRRDPSKALGLAEDHGAAFSEGALAEEREVIRIDALVRLGRLEDAKAAASAFRARHPQSSHLTRVIRLVEAAR